MNYSLQETLLKNIRFAYNEAIEFIVSMGMLACEDQLADLAAEYKIEIDELLGTYFEDARKLLSPHFTRELMFFFRHNFFIMLWISRYMNPPVPIQKRRLPKNGSTDWRIAPLSISFQRWYMASTTIIWRHC